ncbi:MAG TPA: thymidine phosphorylase, partial [Pirellulaceae bacterium]|nr:thymidine phosphorylase [Pirellulaceae bacterium]
WVPMLSGRGLGATGGTLDKLEAIPGFRTDLDPDEIRRQTERMGCVITGASSNLAPADKKLYALRDVTGTVASIPLLTSSIMSKKLAEGLHALVLDVKFGSGAFMKTREHARELAHSLVATGRRMGVATTALLTDMHQPLGRMAGNAVEVDESLAVLRGEGPTDLRTVTLELAVELLLSAGLETAYSTALARLSKLLDSGAAHEKFRAMVAAQGGDLDAPRRIAAAQPIVARRAGYISAIDAEQLGVAIIELGGGRRQLTDLVNHSVGLEMLVRIGDAIEMNQPLVRLFADLDDHHRVAPRIEQAITISEESTSPQTLVVERIGG